MSEPVTEPVEPTEPETTEPDTTEQSEPEPDTSDGEPSPDAEPTEPIEPDEPDGEPEQPQSSAIDEKEIERRLQRLDAENVRHAKRVGEIMDDDATDLIPCPVCMDGIAGWIYPPDAQPLTAEAVSRIRTVIGLPDYTTFKHAPDATECPDCGGLGEVITGSHVPGYETKTCGRCGKTGWVPMGQPANGTTHLVEVPQTTGPTVYQTDDSSDPEIQHLRERGFTVIPPMNIPQVQG
jgi:hypothetical protein